MPKQTPALVERWYSVDELAERYQVPRKTILSWNFTGTGPRPVRFGKYVRYSSAEVLRWEMERERQSA